MKSTAPRIVRPIQAHLDISLVSAAILLRSLHLASGDSSFSSNQITVATGSYRLLPYALEYWIEHCLLYTSMEGTIGPNQALPYRLTQLREKHDQILQNSGALDQERHA